MSFKNKKFCIKKYTISLFFKPLCQITKKEILLLPFKKQDKKDEPEWSLDCSGQGECQPNVSPSDGDEKMDFYNEALEQQKSKEVPLSKNKKDTSL